MKMNELNAIFTNLVAEYIIAGYNINVDTMGGSQGEIGKSISARVTRSSGC